MTDEQIVLTIAEFMGRSCPWRCVRYLYSYDDLAPAYRKFYDKYPPTESEDRFSWWADNMCSRWFHGEPREHAAALATAIQEAKG